MKTVNLKKRRLEIVRSVALIVFIVVPFSMQAAWWDPFSWFSDNTGRDMPSSLQGSPQDEDRNDSMLINGKERKQVPMVKASPEANVITKENIDIRPAEKTIVQTVMVDNPELLKKIQQLTTENSALQAENLNLKNANYSLQASTEDWAKNTVIPQINELKNTCNNNVSRILAEAKEMESFYIGELRKMAALVGRTSVPTPQISLPHECYFSTSGTDLLGGSSGKMTCF